MTIQYTPLTKMYIHSRCVTPRYVPLPLLQMAENCPISSLNMSFCYKVPLQEVEILLSMLRAKGNLQNFEGMRIPISPIALELLISSHSLTKISMCGVQLITDATIELVYM